MNTSFSIVNFSKRAESLEGAAVLLRECIGLIKPLRNSLVGRNPACAGALGSFSKRLHEEARKFKTRDGMWDYQRYMEGLLKDARTIHSDNQPSFESFGDRGFRYEVSSGRAWICLKKVEGASEEFWVVAGSAKFFRNPDIVVRNLKSKGFETETLDPAADEGCFAS